MQTNYHLNLATLSFDDIEKLHVDSLCLEQFEALMMRVTLMILETEGKKVKLSSRLYKKTEEQVSNELIKAVIPNNLKRFCDFARLFLKTDEMSY